MKAQNLKIKEDASRVKSWYKSDYNQKVCGAKVIAGSLPKPRIRCQKKPCQHE